MSSNTSVVEFISADQHAEVLEDLAAAPNVKFLKMFPRKGNLTRAKVVSAFHDAFDQIGGVSRLSLWADSNPEKFFALYARLLPPASHPDLNGDTELRVIHVLPPTKLDRE